MYIYVCIYVYIDTCIYAYIHVYMYHGILLSPEEKKNEIILCAES